MTDRDKHKYIASLKNSIRLHYKPITLTSKQQMQNIIWKKQRISSLNRKSKKKTWYLPYSSDNPTYKVDKIEWINSYKYLGIYLDDKFYFAEQ